MISKDRHGPWCVIAGGSEGLGESFARQIGQAGLNLVLIARNGPKLDEVARAVRGESGVQVRTLVTDLTSSDMLDPVREVTDELDVGLLVYNAGSSRGVGRFVEATLDASMQVLRLNSVGQLILCHHFGRKMAERRRGGIMLMGSMAGNAGGATTVAYSGAKAFTQIFAEALWSELNPLGVDVLCAVLGAMDTPSRAAMQLRDSAGQIVSHPDEIAQLCLENIGNGPVLVPPHLEQAFHQFCSMPRREAADTMTALLAGLRS
jgi:short-subunit dehydrogenase